MSATPQLPALVVSEVERRLGSKLTFEARVGRSATSARVYRVRGEPGELFLKWHREPRRFEQERAFYERFAPAFPKQVPSLLAVFVHERLLVLSACSGWREESAAAFTAAGRFIAALHALPFRDEDPVPVRDALLARISALRRDAESPALAARLAEAERELAQLAHGPLGRVVCHRDFQPDNWLFDPNRSAPLSVLDFEHSRPDLGLFDLARLDLLYLSARPDLAAAFWGGYGAAPAEQHAALYEVVKLMEAARTTIWAERHADPGFQAEAERMWRALDPSR